MENKGMLPFPLLSLFGFPSALLHSSPLKVIFLVELSVCPCPCGDPGMVMCSALHYLWSLTSAQVSGEDLNTSRRKEAEFWDLGLVWPPHELQKACSAWSPVSGSLTMVIVKWEQSWGFASICTLSPCSAPLPPTRVYVSAHPVCPGEAGAEWCFPYNSGVPGGLPWDDHFRHITE